jgi:hypothetical protein
MADEDIQAGPPPDEPAPPPRPRARPPRADREYDDDRLRRPDPVETLIPYRNPMALAGYYVGVFSLIPCFGALLGPLALVFGCLGVRYRKRNPTAGGLGHAVAGIVLGSLTTLANWGVIIATAIAVAVGAAK